MLTWTIREYHFDLFMTIILPITKTDDHNEETIVTLVLILTDINMNMNITNDNNMHDA